jgi:hypothetical protein
LLLCSKAYVTNNAGGDQDSPGRGDHDGAPKQDPPEERRGRQTLVKLSDRLACTHGLELNPPIPNGHQALHVSELLSESLALTQLPIVFQLVGAASAAAR